MPDTEPTPSLAVLDPELENSWDKAYWFARMLIDTDRYGGVGSSQGSMTRVSGTLNALLQTLDTSGPESLATLHIALHDSLLSGHKQGTKTYPLVQALYEELSRYLITCADYKVLALTCSKIMIPINTALQNIPSHDTEFTTIAARSLLEAQGVHGLATLINIWDDLGTRGCVAVEREQVVQAFGWLRGELESVLSVHDQNAVFTAFVQEFERRVGQKRKSRAGSSLENDTQFILDFFGFSASDAPEHFTTSLEVDRWVLGSDGWYIGISCKRTLRERWKQVSTTDVDLLNRHRIRQLWHVITYDRDLSDDKITEMGSHRQVIYLPDSSPRLDHALRHPGMCDYVRPMSSFVDSLRDLTG
jgi:hypothetical protein